MDGGEKKKWGKIKIESEKWRKNLWKPSEKSRKHGINRARADFPRFKNLHAIHIHVSWMREEKMLACLKARGDGKWKKSPRPHERKMFPYKFFRSTYIRMEGNRISNLEGWGTTTYRRRGKIMCLTNKEIRTLHRIKQIFKGLCEFFLI